MGRFFTMGCSPQPAYGNQHFTVGVGVSATFNQVTTADFPAVWPSVAFREWLLSFPAKHPSRHPTP
jgi:hypothetical protein